MIIAGERGVWDAAMEQPLLGRHGSAPADLLRHVGAVNAASGMGAARAAVVGADFLADVLGAIAELPEALTARLHASFLGVYFTHALGSSAITDIVVTPEGEFLGVVIALDVDAFLLRRANEWFSWRENTPFRAAPGYALEARIAEDARDDRCAAIQFLLLHEFGHVLAAGRRFLPDWWIGAEHFLAREDYVFLPLSWDLTEDGRIVALAENDFALRARIVYYAAPQIEGAAMAEVYRALRQTSFPTLYASTTVYEDFAESFACYVHTVLLGKPFAVRIRHHGELVLDWELDWRGARLAGKYALFERFLGART
ncbi:hypothetical protein [Janthinobacterium sp.]|uniref:hypothetical protein n=1 Tax=Janthinobacterium sp. TaxID=1871054 RepID=UPI00293D8CE0|nr:hypothetical protein [Janthinobacterium sp.]